MRPKHEQQALQVLDRFRDRARRTLDDSPAVERVLDAVAKRVARSERLSQEADPLLRLVRSYVRGSYRTVGVSDVALALAGLLYIQSPIDAIPDYLPGGLKDDEWVAHWVTTRIADELSAYHKWEDSFDVSLVVPPTATAGVESPRALQGLSVQTIDPADAVLFTRVDLPSPQKAPPIALNGILMSANSLDSVLKAGQVMRVVGPEHVLAGLNSGALELIHSAGGNLGTVRDVGSKDFAGQLRFSSLGDGAGAAKALAGFQLASAVTLQYYLARIDRQLGELQVACNRALQDTNDNRFAAIETARARCETVERAMAVTGAIGAQDTTLLSQAFHDLDTTYNALVTSCADFCARVERMDLESISKDSLKDLLDEGASAQLADMQLLLYASVVRHRIHGVQLHLYADDGEARVALAVEENARKEAVALEQLERCRQACAKLNVPKRTLDRRWGIVGGPEKSLQAFSSGATPMLARLSDPRGVLPSYATEAPFVMELMAGPDGEVLLQWAELRAQPILSQVRQSAAPAR